MRPAQQFGDTWPIDDRHTIESASRGGPFGHLADVLDQHRGTEQHDTLTVELIGDERPTPVEFADQRIAGQADVVVIGRCRTDPGDGAHRGVGEAGHVGRNGEHRQSAVPRQRCVGAAASHT